MLTDRQVLILRKIIEEFVSTAEPVGSRTLSKLEDLAFSPATIRNEMADLEELGYLEKTHTSSGRIPSEKGYRYYVDYILANQQKDENEYPVLDSIFAQKDIMRDEAVKQAVKILSEITNYTSIILGPTGYNSKVQKFQFVPINNKLAVIVLVTDTGHVQSNNLKLNGDIDLDEVEKIINIMNDLLTGCYVHDIPQKLNYEIKPYIKQYMDYHDRLIDTMVKMFGKLASEDIYLSGQSRMISLPEFRDIDKLKKLFKAIEDKQIFKLISSQNSEMSIRIGHENEIQAMDNCTLISVPYRIKGEEYGKIAILGPTRMDYSQVIPLLEYIAKHISNLYE